MKPWLTTLAAALVAVALWGTAAEAHRPNVKSHLLGAGADDLTIFEVLPQPPGWIKLAMNAAPPGGALVLTVQVKKSPTDIGAVEVWTFPLPAVTNARLYQWPFARDLKNQDHVEITAVELQDKQGATIAELGSTVPPTGGMPGRYIMSAPLVYLLDSTSPVGYTRGGDTTLLPDGRWTVGFDALRDRMTNAHLNNTGNYAEISYLLNGVPKVARITFDVRSGKAEPAGRPVLRLGLKPGDHIAVRSVDVFDSSNRKFATIGVRIGLSGDYPEEVPLP
jgi:hypothetical protein